MQLLLIPPTCVVVAIMWNAWAGRDRRPTDVVSTVEAHRRLLDALAPRGANSLRH